MADPIVAAISFFALGANLLGAGLLLLFNPENREVRWYVGFLALIMIWLLGQGVNAVTGEWGAWDYPYSVAVTLLPAAFVAIALLDDPARAPRHFRAALALGVAAVPLGLSAMTDLLSFPADGPLFWVYQVAGWAGGSVILSRSHRRRRRARDARTPLDRAVTGFLVLIAPAVVALAFLLGAEPFFRYGMPLVTVVIQFAIFVGVSRMRFYDIEVRAARSGELAARIAETERLAVVGELAATVAHEVRNPLTGVRSLAQRIAEGGLEEERRRRYAGVILEEAGRIDRIVGNLLGLARRPSAPEGRGEPERQEAETPLGPLFEDLHLLAGTAAGKAGVELEMTPGDGTAPALRDPLAQALLNLLLNGIRVSPEGGRVSVDAESRDDGTTIRVRDSGPGIPSAERERIFEPFRTAGDGAGLGLSVVRRLSREHGWEVGVAEAPGGGAEFVLRVPASGEGPRREAARSRAPARPGPEAASARTSSDSRARDPDEGTGRP